MAVVNSKAPVRGNLCGTSRALETARLAGNAAERKGKLLILASLLILGSGRHCNRRSC